MTALWLVLAGVGLLVVALDVAGALSASRQGRSYSFVSTLVVPPLLVILGVISLVASGDSWIFNKVLGLVLLLAGIGLLAVVGVLIKRALRPSGPTTD